MLQYPPTDDGVECPRVKLVRLDVPDDLLICVLVLRKRSRRLIQAGETYVEWDVERQLDSRSCVEHRSKAAVLREVRVEEPLEIAHLLGLPHAGSRVRHESSLDQTL